MVGVRGYEVNEDLAASLKLPVKKGILVVQVYRGGSADKAGIRGADRVVNNYFQYIRMGGDIITEIAGKPVGSLEELRLALESKRPGDTVPITFYRGQSKLQKSIVLVEAPSQRSTRNKLPGYELQ
jgi:S1-C subfamily serine protease